MQGCFVRNTKEVSLSEDGIKLYKYAKQMLDLQREIEVTFGMDEEGESHAVTIAASTIPAQYLLPEVLTRFSERYPQEQIRIQETDSSKSSHADCGSSGRYRVYRNGTEKKHCKYIPFYKDELHHHAEYAEVSEIGAREIKKIFHGLRKNM